MKAIEDYVGSLGLDAYLVGGAVRDELLGRDSKDADFLVAGVDTDGLRAALEPHGKVDDLVVAGRPVGLRLYPRSAELRALAPAGIEFAPPRRERSTGPGRHDFEIVVDPNASVEDDLARRDFTVNAIARRLADGELVDPFRGRGGPRARRPAHGLAAQLLRGSAAARARRCASSRSSASSPTRRRCARCTSEAASVQLVSGERIGGGLAVGRDGRAVEAAARPRAAPGAPARARHGRARRAAAGVRARGRLRPGEPLPRPHRRRAHVRGRPGDGRRTASPLRVRLAALFHDLGKPHVGWRGRDGRLHFYARPGNRDHADVGAELADGALQPAALSDRAARAGRAHRPLPHVQHRQGRHAARAAAAGALRRGARARPARPQGGRPARQGPTTGRATSTSSSGCARFRAVVEQERSSPHRLSDLERRRHRPDRARLPPGARARPHAADAARGGRRRPGAEPARRRCSRARRRCCRRDPLGRAGRTSSRSRRGSAASARGRSTRSTSAAAATTRRAWPRTGGAPARRSGSTRRGSRVNRQRHTPTVHRAVAGRVGRAGRRALDATSPGCRCSRSRPTACRSRSRGRTAARPRSPSCTRAGAASPTASSRRACARSATGRRARSSGPRSGRAATRSARRSRRASTPT